VNKAGEYGSATIFEGADFAVCDSRGARLEKCAFMYARAR